ncbi:NlpC/P60 family protein [Streptomyces sp. NBC_01462]|uniref:NlpC/P60 family protein n=1 Tax=Streptomyces sp. NBC_01462 TaxID=2903876 RepID=UPI003FCDDEE9
MPRSAPATVARSSADLVPQSPNSASLGGDDGPSREEVQQRISSLYDRAETATGNYNATRAMTTGSRYRLNPARDNGRRGGDATLDDVSRPWLDVGRAQLGPSAPARLPADRMPKRPAEARPAPSAKRLDGGPAARALETAGRPVPELTAGPGAGPVAELTAGPAAGPVAELAPGRAVAALPAGIGVRQETGVRQEIVKALPAPAADSDHSSLKNRKEQNRRKLALARELLSRHAVRQRSIPIAAIEAQPAQEVWPTPEERTRREAEERWRRQQSAGLGMGAPVDTAAGMGASAGMDASLGAGMPLASDMTYTSDMTFTSGVTFASDTAFASGVMFTSDTAFAPGTAYAPELSYAQDMAYAPDQFQAPEPLPAPDLPFAPEPPAAAETAYIPAMTFAPAPFPPVVSTPFPPAVAPDPSFAAVAPVNAGVPTTAGMVMGGGGPSGSGYDMKAAKALAFARAQIGRPCVWGAAGPGSYDCAGLTRAAWTVAGVALPRTARDQATATTAIPLTDIRAGDLIFFYDDVSHVGLYIGDSMMIHAPSPGAYIREESIFYAGQAAIHSAARPA